MKSLKKYFFLLLGLNPIFLQAQEFLRWSDEFNGNSLDTNFWSYQIGNGCPNLCGWGNNELQFYKQENVRVQNGILNIAAKKETVGSNTYTSARIRTLNKVDFASGKIEVRARVPVGRGYWPAVWFLPSENHYGIWPLSGEIDLLEGKGQEPQTTHGTIHYGAYVPNNRYTGNTYTLSSGSFASDFHVYTLQWNENAIEWYVDDILYSTKTRVNTNPFWWPFDRNFHVIMNLAVGGNFLGYPDASTPDTASFQVDYIRVYQNLSQIFVSGPDAILRKDTNQIFYTQELPGASYLWEVPAGAIIRNGANLARAKVDWGLRSDSIFVTITHQGKSKKIAKWVRALPDTCEGVIDNLENRRSIYWVGSTGTFAGGITNPAKDSINSSNSVNRYYRNSAVSYDAMVLKAMSIKNATEFEGGNLLLKMKLYTTAPVGTEININFENRARAGQDYPIGRRCVLQAKTTRTRAWEELTFKLILRPDPNTLDGSIDQLVILLAPNTSTNDVYFFDDFSLEERPCKELQSATEEIEANNSGIHVYPNPITDQLQLDLPFEATTFELYDMHGKLVTTASSLPDLNNQLPNMTAGVYWLQVGNGMKQCRIKLVKIL
jgi:beta-glucanase (GH16 family)